MIQHTFRRLIERYRCTLLGVGPMSVNCVNAAIELANDNEVPIMMIASRRQIDSEEFGGGYVNNWTTDEFARYVAEKDKKGKIFLARDHGGPWQNEHEKEKNLGLRRAMDSAKSSYRADIEAGFQILHLDPSVDIHGKPNVDEVLDRLFDLYEYCWTQANRMHQEIAFEVGTEEQSGSTNTQEELDYTLNAIGKFCRSQRIDYPTFVVVQCGTKVMEMRNVGSFESPVRVANEIPAEIQLPKMLEICNRHGIFMKEHNTDYLSDEALQWHPRLGIHSANVAPEFGVGESKALVAVLEKNGLGCLADQFLELAYNSRKWEKWMLDGSCATDRERALIAGHYVFSTPECLELKQKASAGLVEKHIDLEGYLKSQIKQNILRYLRSFRLLRTA